MLRELGKFVVNSGKLRVSDPCYDDSVWCKGTIANVKLGTWKAFAEIAEVDGWGTRVLVLSIAHESYRAAEPIEWKTAAFQVGVDSGQAGFWDEPEYHKTGMGEYGDPNSFYGQACNITTDKHAGVMTGGVVSASGFGDGGYQCEYVELEGFIVAARITFIGNDEDDEV